MQRFCVIMAGGIGSRFWPLSTDACPKQFLDVLGTGKSFIRATFERFLPLVEPQHFVVVTNAAYKNLVLQHLPELTEDQVLCEPMRRNTAPCIAYALRHITARCPEASIVVSPADHLVTNQVEFCRVVDRALQFAEADQSALLTIGIRPSRPETGYGYIEVASAAEGIVPVVSFKEKPDLPTAQRFLAAGNYHWNSGIFIWSAHAIEDALRTFLPELMEVMDGGRDAFGTPAEQSFINEAFARCPNISIDYGVMERSQSRYTIAADFGWSDIGTWGSLYTHAAHDAAANAATPNSLLVDAERCVVNIDPTAQAIVQGVSDCLVALRGNQLLVCRLADEQRIKEWVEQLAARR